MDTITLEDEIIETWRTLSISQKHSVLQLIHSFKQEEIELTAEEIEEYNKDIEEAELRIANGQFTTHGDVVKSFAKWK